MSFGALSLGAWKANPRSGTAGIDPYARAAIARNGELPVGTGDGIRFTASVDDSGRPLDGRCDVVDVQRVINASLGQTCRTGP
jgi:hypothetical protein